MRTGRWRAILCGGMASLLPDFVSCAYLRAGLWRLAGAKIHISSTAIRSGAFIEHPTRFRAGPNLVINRDAYLDGSGGLVFGDNVTVSHGCKILTLQHEGDVHEREVFKRTEIGSNSIIYAGAIILPGAKLAPFTVVAAGAVLRGNTEERGVYAGVPAVLKGFRK